MDSGAIRAILGLFEARSARARKGVVAALSAGSLGSIVAFLGRVSVGFPPPSVVRLIGVLFAALACGWAIRGGFQTLIWASQPAPKDKRRGRLRLIAASSANAGLASAWVAYATTRVGQTDPVLACEAMTAASVLVFGLSLWTLSETRALGYPRASDWVYEHLRAMVEPGESTWPGWLLLKLIDWRSDSGTLSTYVSGTLALLLTAIVLTAPAVVRLASGESARRHPGAIAAARNVEGGAAAVAHDDPGAVDRDAPLLAAPLAALPGLAGTSKPPCAEVVEYKFAFRAGRNYTQLVISVVRKLRFGCRRKGLNSS